MKSLPPARHCRHVVRAVTFPEDEGQPRSGNGPRVFAALCNIVPLLRRLGFKPVDGREQVAETRSRA